MSAATLEPRFAATLAQDAYRLKDDITRRIVLSEHKDKLEVSEELSGKTGALIVIKSSHVMGIGAFGVGDHEGEAFVILKGTASGFDALTDLNAGITRAKSGGQVHQGFQYTFESYLPQLQGFLAAVAKRKNVKVIHCVGHSLGGALATLTADWLNANSSVPVKLYTFGSPRVGFPFYANDVTDRVVADNIYRVYHKTDPVPMVPTWPFTHIPDTGTDYLLNSGLALLPWEYHKMENYISSVSSGGTTSHDWRDLHAMRPPELLEKSVENWLKSDGPVSLCLNTARLLDAALLWVVKKIFHAGFTVLIGVGTTTFTILDRLAYMMHKAYDFTKDLGYWVMRLITRMARALGIVVTETTKLSVSFIRMIFTRIHSNVSEMVRKAAQAVD